MADLSEAVATELRLQRTFSARSRHPSERRLSIVTLGRDTASPNAIPPTSKQQPSPSGSSTTTVCSLTAAEEDDVELVGAENPYNWSIIRKTAITIATCFNTLGSTMGSSIFTPGMVELRTSLGMNEIAGYGLVSLYIGGMALGPLLFAPMSEVYGRRLVLVPAWIALVGFTAGCAASKNTATIMVCRLLGGIAASPTVTVAGGMMTDIWPPSQLGSMGLFTMIAFLGPVLGPIIGGYLVQNLSPEHGWRWSFWFLVIFCGACALNWLWIPETYVPTLIEQKKRRNASLKEQNQPEKPKSESNLLLYKRSITRPLLMLVLDPVVFLSSLYVSFVFAIVYLFLGAYPIVFRGRYGMKAGEAGLAFLGIGLGVMLVFPAAGYANIHYLRLKKARGIELDKPFPEGRLLMAIFGAVLPPISLFWFAWTGKKDIHWIVPILSGVPFGLGLTTVFISLVSYLAEAYYECSASALAANTIMRSLMAATFPLFVSDMYQNMTPEWASSTLGFISIAFIPVPWLFWKYGVQLRAKSKFRM